VSEGAQDTEEYLGHKEEEQETGESYIMRDS